MARGPYQGLYQSGIRPTVVTAPDALVYINGELTVQGCPSCQKRFDLGRYITSIQVDLTVDSPPGSATISLSLPRHIVDNFYFEGTPIISPMMEVEIFAKGYYILEGLPQYYPIFWGLTTEVGESYSGGEHTVSIHCEGILKWWDLCKMNINPALTQQTGQLGRSIYGNVLYGSNPFDLIWTLAMQSMGDIVVGSGSLVSLYKEASQTKVFTTVMADIMRYWNYRFSKIRSNLLLYGSQGVAVRGDSLYSLYQERKGNICPNFASKAVRTANGGDVGRQFAYDPTDPSVTAYRTQFQQAGQVNFFQAEFQTKLEIANTCKDAIGYEFYMDVTGDIVFKPPFYNLDILSNKPISWIQDIDIIDWDLSESESEVVTQLQLQGSYGGNVDYGFPEEATPYTSVTDYHLLRKYGWRTQTFNSEFLGSPLLMFYAGMDMLDRMNAKRHRGTVSIPFRPELRLGFPIYLAPKDQIWYVNGISHNIQFGSRAQTTLTLTAKREKYLAPKGIGRLSMANYTGGKKVATPPSNNPPTGASGGGAPSADSATPQANESARYTARQLAVSATFKLEASNPTGIAQMPFLPVNEKATPTDDPYRPVILRHPKTGRVMGWPNVVVAYTRPLLPTDNEIIAKNAGRKVNTKKGEDQQSKARKEINATGPGTVNSVENAIAALDQDKAYEKHMSHRYSYGITSAGVYVYAHDTSKKINEMTILPVEKLQVVTAEGQTPPKFTKSVMIRPVSDERGFEVIGHHSYGRGVSLRDGSLVLQTGDKNKRTEIGVQLALTGDMTASLLAQSQGITTTVSGYANPASVVAKLQPEDLETAAVVNPETQKSEYDTTKQNFIDAAPLGTPENKGLPPNVEASQLSRALTLAEMRVREAYDRPEDDNCSCLSGRSDLAFMSFGYQIKPLSMEAKDLAPFDTSLGSSSELQQAMADAVGLRPYSHKGVMGRVTTFLTDLYNLLDGSHQEVEKILRGSLTVRDSSGAVANRSSVATEPSSLEPPYSAESRYSIGDPNATLKQYDSASKEIANQWKKAGDDLKKSSKKAKLQQEIANLEADITRLKQEADRMQQKIQAGRATQADLEPIQSSIFAKNKQIQDKQLELSGLG